MLGSCWLKPKTHTSGRGQQGNSWAIIKDRGVLGADGLHEIRILNRVITYHPAKLACPEMLTYEADQRHADLLMAAYGLNVSSKGKPTPWDKAAFLARHPLAGPFLDEKRRVAFRSNCMRCLYLALDRPDIQCRLSTPMKRSRLFRGTWLAIFACCGDTHGKNGLEMSGG